ncbi:MAG: hypothetical protein VR68_03125 [Peptococcaceae bacterium BRH_c4a]|nr:MAG: hypothetical protein VR68_03125 [Peptococcaceae bacterium BRH_c4a]
MKKHIALSGVLMVFLLIFFWSEISFLEWKKPVIRLDGSLDDWGEKTFLADGQGDTAVDADLKAVFWGTGENDQKLYFMVERFSPENAGSKMTCRVYFDVNSNGSYEDAVDKYSEVVYSPGLDGEVEVSLYSVAGNHVNTYSGNLGESIREGGRRFEFALSMEDINVFPAQPVRFYISGAGSGADRLPDQGDVLWMPFPVVTKSRSLIAVGFLIWCAAIAFFYRHRIWLFYYIVAAVGFTYISILLLRGSFLEYQMENLVGLLIHYILNFMDIKTNVFDKAPGTILVLIEVDRSWTTIDIDIESSGLLEMCILLGLLLFYPGYSLFKRLVFSPVSVFIVFVINLIRIMVVITIIHLGGRDMIFLAHTLFGRIVFFILIVALYWHLLTKPTLKIVREYVSDG